MNILPVFYFISRELPFLVSFECFIYIQVYTNTDFYFSVTQNVAYNAHYPIPCFLNLIHLRASSISVREELLYSFSQLHSTPCCKSTVLIKPSLSVNFGLSPAFCYYRVLPWITFHISRKAIHS